MMRTLTKRRWIASAMMVVAVSQFGCASMAPKSLFASKDKAAKAKPESGFSLASKMPWAKKDSKPKPYPNPAKMAVTWTPDTLVQTGRTPTRGFGGRIYFYDEHAHAVPVEGTLVIHGFDETAEDEKDRVKRFEFTPEQFTRHFSQSDLGASYSIWVPWDAVGGPQERISLMASFQSTTEATPPIQGISSVVVLPGRKSGDQLAEYQTPLSPQYTKWREASSANTPPNTGLTTTTIQRRPSAGPPARDFGKQLDSMIARGNSTPSLDIPMAPRTTQSKVLPTGAFTPLP